jgi:hypothetical protein
MSEKMGNRCFVLLPSGDPHYARLFDEVFSLAIMEAGLVPYRVQQSPSEPLSIDLLLNEIAKADFVLADLSQNGEQIWFALGCALALKKQLCLTSSKATSRSPLSIRSLKILSYPADALPSDYRELEKKIKNQLLGKEPEPVATKPTPVAAKPEPVASQPAPAAAKPELVASQPAPVATKPEPVAAQPVQVAPQPAPVAAQPILVTAPIPPESSLSKDLTAHEVLALTIIDVHASAEGLSPRALGLEMQTRDSAHLTSHAMNSLKRRKFIERRPVPVADGAGGYISDNLFITWSGKNWLLQHSQRTNSLRSNSSARQFIMSSR